MEATEGMNVGIVTKYDTPILVQPTKCVFHSKSDPIVFFRGSMFFLGNKVLELKLGEYFFTMGCIIDFICI